jgi:hypothetical protein
METVLNWARKTFPAEFEAMIRLWKGMWSISKTISILAIIAIGGIGAVGGFIVGKFAGTTNNIISNPPSIINIGTPPPGPRGAADNISSLSDQELLDYTVKFAAGLRIFEANALISRQRMIRNSDAPNDASRSVRIMNEQFVYETTEFKNTLLQPAQALRDEIMRRLRAKGIFIDVANEMTIANGMKMPIIAFDGLISGVSPIADMADFLESAVRKIPK